MARAEEQGACVFVMQHLCLLHHWGRNVAGRIYHWGSLLALLVACNAIFGVILTSVPCMSQRTTL